MSTSASSQGLYCWKSSLAQSSRSLTIASRLLSRAPAFLPLALYTILMHCWFECFDEVPYLCVSAATKQSGKTRVLELLRYLAGERRACMLSGDVTAPALFEEITMHRRTLLIDEAERMQKRNSPLRQVMNVGYRRGSYVLRKGVRYDTYAPKVMAQMRAMPINDFFAKNGKIRIDGRMVHDMYLFEVKKPSESKGEWDVYKLLATVPGDEAFRPLDKGGCPLVKSN